jgi:hypothetical protein
MIFLLFWALISLLYTVTRISYYRNVRRSGSESVHYFEPPPVVFRDDDCPTERAVLDFLLGRSEKWSRHPGDSLTMTEGTLNAGLDCFLQEQGGPRSRSGTGRAWTSAVHVRLARGVLVAHITYGIPPIPKMEQYGFIPPRRLSNLVSLTRAKMEGKWALVPTDFRLGRRACLMPGTCFRWVTQQEVVDALTFKDGSLAWLWTGYLMSSAVSEVVLEEGYLTLKLSR